MGDKIIRQPVVAVVGSRDFANLWYVRLWLKRLADKYPEAVIVSGGARGVDTEAEVTARNLGLSVLSIRPTKHGQDLMDEYAHLTWAWDLDIHGEAAEALVVERKLRINPPMFRSFPHAAYARNKKLVSLADYVVAFWDGQSRGTKHAIEKAREVGKLKLVRRNEDLVMDAVRELQEQGVLVEPTRADRDRLRRR